MAARNVEWMLAHVNHVGEECLLWPFGKCRGYGQLKWDGKIRRATRVMCELAHGEAPTQQHHAAHSCGNSECINPRHLSWKTPSENQLDKREHGRFYKDGARKLLSYADAEKIRSLAGSMTQDAIAKQFGVSRRNIGAILTGKTQTRPLNREKITNVLSRSGSPMTSQEIANATGIDPVSVTPMLSKLKQTGIVVRVRQATYQIAQSPK